jgi:hypothetical protein
MRVAAHSVPSYWRLPCLLGDLRDKLRAAGSNLLMRIGTPGGLVTAWDLYHTSLCVHLCVRSNVWPCHDLACCCREGCRALCTLLVDAHHAAVPMLLLMLLVQQAARSRQRPARAHWDARWVSAWGVKGIVCTVDPAEYCLLSAH